MSSTRSRSRTPVIMRPARLFRSDSSSGPGSTSMVTAVVPGRFSVIVVGDRLADRHGAFADRLAVLRNRDMGRAAGLSAGGVLDLVADAQRRPDDTVGRRFLKHDAAVALAVLAGQQNMDGRMQIGVLHPRADIRRRVVNLAIGDNDDARKLI